MPLHSELPIVRVEHGSMHTIETGNAENLFGLWSLFSKCSPAMEDGRRYENMAWRVWGRETLCCPPVMMSPQWAFERQLAANNAEVPDLSTSVGSDDSTMDSAITTTSRSTSSTSRPDLRRHDSTASQARGKHLTPIDLEKVVNSIQEKKAIEPLSPLPPQLAPPVAEPSTRPAASTFRPASPPVTARRIPQPATSPLAAIRGSDAMALSPLAHSEVSSSLEASNHSVVRGFEPGHISTSIRSSTNLAPTPILKKTSSFLVKPLPSKAEPMTKKKQPMFTLGGSSDEDNSSSLEAYSLAQRSSLSEHLRRGAPPMRKTLSFKNEVNTRTYHDATSDSDGAIETDSEDEPDESAIEEEDSDGDWEDDNDDSGPSSVTEQSMFKRVDSKPNLVSRRSLLTTMMHEGDRAQALQNAASRSTPAIRRSRTSTPNGPSIGNSPQEDSGLMMRQQVTRAKPIIMTTSNVHPPALSPRTTRRNMLQTELSGSLRQNLLWERQQKNATTNAVIRRAMTTTDLRGLDAAPQPRPSNTKTTNSYQEDYFGGGISEEYHAKGW
ncbi:DUF1752-domain-containing protein [Dothidotthia symphoricarpi CBS 119687]|uniref:DUF1752-domain-containing protein n=1 Tax=Dothidotthia symphoricarpi CBS 119687 TaxID=1392245 RepID=A0A6A5ZYX7_9PLEO|nr:DUF1752-domain-containing protein [Dothidotthia symphoricarpi CBS 119687]KAF2124083.1 DUF1752-domain-containing protein [Dothidotthia symphoricarpi CBS 119687]